MLQWASAGIFLFAEEEKKNEKENDKKRLKKFRLLHLWIRMFGLSTPKLNWLNGQRMFERAHIW